MLTGALVSIDEADADHAPPHTFDVLARLFLNARKIVPDETMLTPSADNQFGRLLVDRVLAADWHEYHHSLADLRIVAKLKHRTLSQENRQKAENRQLILRTGEGAA